MRETTEVVSLKPWQFSIRRMLAATAALAGVLGFFGPAVGYHNAIVWLLSVVVVGSILVSHVGRITFGACAILACVYLATLVGALLRDGASNPPRNDIYTAVVGLPALMMVATCFRAYGGFNVWHLLGSLIVFETFLVVLISSIAFMDGATVDFYSVFSWFVVPQWYIVAPWLFGAVLGGTIVRRNRSVQPTRQSSSS